MNTDSNSVTALESLIARCTESLQRGKEGGMASLEAHQDAGAALVELKDLLPRGKFGPVAEQRCGCTRQWRARLMELSRHWHDVQAALRWAEADAPELLRKAYSVDGALALIKVWRRVNNGHARPARKPRTAKTGSGSILHREVAALKQKLSAAAGYIAALEEELAARAVTPNTGRQDIDATDRRKVRSVASLWLRPGTEGEGLAAAHQLRALARRMGWPIRDLLHACEIEGPADWTFTSAP
jgi:hypothetical protein